MKSYGQLWERITSAENLLAAWGRVQKGHGGSQAVLAFGRDAERLLAGLHDELLAGTYRPGAYVQFRVRDPKPRTISCAPVRDRVLHHALCGVITPLLERRFTEDSYACREGKGTHRACARARALVRLNPWYCKIDVRHYFDSIGHDRLQAVLLPLFREREVRELVERIVRHPVPGQAEGRGLPIGNLTSQWFANVFLDGFDHHAKEVLRLPGYIRYMDDMVLFAGSKAACWQALDEAQRWLRDERGLELKAEATRLAPVTEGLPFLGLRIFPACWRLQRERFLRTRRKFAARQRAFEEGSLDEARLQACAVAADGGVRWFGFKNILRTETDQGNRRRCGVGVEPRDPGRELEQQREQLPFRQPQQQQPEQPEQQHRLPRRQHRAARTGRVPSGEPVSHSGGNEQVQPRAAGSAGESRAGGFSGGIGGIPAPGTGGEHRTPHLNAVSTSAGDGGACSDSVAVMALGRDDFDGDHGIMNRIDQPVLTIDSARPKARKIAPQQFRLPCPRARMLPQLPQQRMKLAQQRHVPACLVREDVFLGRLGKEDGIHYRLPKISCSSLSPSNGTVLPFRACAAEERMAFTLLRFIKYGSPLGLGLPPPVSRGQTRTERRTVLPSGIRGCVSGTKTFPSKTAFSSLIEALLSFGSTVADSTVEVKQRERQQREQHNPRAAGSAGERRAWGFPDFEEQGLIP